MRLHSRRTDALGLYGGPMTSVDPSSDLPNAGPPATNAPGPEPAPRPVRAAHAAERPVPPRLDTAVPGDPTAGADPHDAAGAPDGPAAGAVPVPAVPASRTAPADPRPADATDLRAATSAPGTTRPPAASTAGLAPEPPTRTGLGGHLLGVVVGLLLGPLAAVAVLVGQGRVLGVQAPAWDAGVDGLGIALVLVGALVAAAVVLLGRWTAAVPMTAGVLLTLAGVIAVVAPGPAHREAVRLLATQASGTTVARATVAATSGSLATLGLAVLAAAVVTVLSRRHGHAIGEHQARAQHTA